MRRKGRNGPVARRTLIGVFRIIYIMGNTVGCLHLAYPPRNLGFEGSVRQGGFCPNHHEHRIERNAGSRR
jgi:hypothetical protein